MISEFKLLKGSMRSLTRRNFLSASAGALALAAASLSVVELHAAPKHEKPNKNATDGALDAFIANYLRAMNAPGITLGTANQSGTVRVAAFGFNDLDTRQLLDPSQLFHIGSITKSFAALVLLQLREEGKLDLEKPILEYLPWLPIENSFGAITTHHLLTHTAGLPDALVLFPTDPNTRWKQAYKPGEKFYYSNVGFDILGHLIEALDGRTWPSAVKARVLDRIGMTNTSPNITDDLRGRIAMSYVPFYGSRPYPRMGKLAPAGNVQFDDAAGSIASTADDMTRYIQMFLNKGQVAGGRIVSEESLALMSKPHVKAEEFGPTASYGYGIAVDTLDGHNVLRHTGGMPSFASAILIDFDGGVGAFASINAMQGYRPTQVVQYAVQLLNAAGAAKPLPVPPKIDDPSTISNAGDYVGTYTSLDGKKIEISGDKQLAAHIDGRTVPLQRAESDAFLTDDPEYARYMFQFGRAKAPEPSKETPSKPESKPATPPVVELSHGAAWFRNDRYTGPTEFHPPEHWKAFTGYYYASGMFPLETEILLRKGELWAEGAFRLIPIGENEFAADGVPERLEFLFLVNGKARLLKFAGADLWRFERT
jgi:D-alanyl-D-alanine carboxypeptidase